MEPRPSHLTKVQLDGMGRWKQTREREREIQKALNHEVEGGERRTLFQTQFKKMWDWCLSFFCLLLGLAICPKQELVNEQASQELLLLLTTWIRCLFLLPSCRFLINLIFPRKRATKQKGSICHPTIIRRYGQPASLFLSSNLGTFFFASSGIFPYFRNKKESFRLSSWELKVLGFFKILEKKSSKCESHVSIFFLAGQTTLPSLSET